MSDGTERGLTEGHRRAAVAWTAAQYLLLVAVAAGGRVFVPSTAGWTLIGAAIVLLAWAVWAFRATRLRITPMVADGGTHIVTGPYRWIRHPMYTSVLLGAAGAVALDPTWVRIASLLLLPFVLGAKLRVEERFLRAAYTGYAEYASRTHRLIPFVW